MTQPTLPGSGAADLYRGDFLGAFSVKDAPDFEDWTRSVTESLRHTAGEVLRRLAIAHAQGEDYTAALAAATRWIGIDSPHEPAHRLVMTLYAWAGDRPGSIQAYRECVAILDRELGVTPLEETTELYDAILDEDLPPAPRAREPTTSHPRTQGGSPSPLIGRQAILGSVDALVRSTRSSRVLLVTGDLWMGKSRLLEHIGELATDEGMTVVAGQAFAAETRLPYGLATQILDALTSRRPNLFEDLPPWAQAELAWLKPSLASARSTSADPFGQVRLREAYLALLEAASADTPVVITIDDGQWADSASAGLFAHMLHRSADLPLLTVLACPSETSLHPALQDRSADAAYRVHLEPLVGDDIVDREDASPAESADAIIKATGGILLLVLEAMMGGVSTTSQSVLQYVAHRRRRLSDLGNQIMAAAAVLGGAHDSHLLRETSGRTEDEVVEGVEELVGADLLREHNDGTLTFSLRHRRNQTRLG